MSTTELWVDVTGYEGYYQVSSLGRIRSLPRIVGGGNGPRRYPGRMMKPDCYGPYDMVELSRNGISRLYTVHRLIAIAFVPNPYEKPEVNHKDGNKRNNAINNLEWATDKENSQHAALNGLLATGGRNGNAKTTDRQAVVIYHKYRTGRLRIRELAIRYGYSEPGIKMVINRGARILNLPPIWPKSRKH